MANTPKKIMKIEPANDYKKPIYAIGLAAAIAASSLALTGCENPMDSINDCFTAGMIDINYGENTSSQKRDADATSASDISANESDEADETT